MGSHISRQIFLNLFGGLICPIRGPVWGPIPGPEIDHNRISKGDAIVALVTSLSSQIMILCHFFETPKSPQTVPQIGLNFGPKSGPKTELADRAKKGKSNGGF